MTPNEAFSALEGEDLVHVVEGKLDELKKLHERCLEAGIPVMLGNTAEACSTKSCSVKAILLGREQDARRVVEVMQNEWHAMVAREGTVAAMAPLQVGQDEELPCPACGTAAPLEQGACSDCGLQLA